MAKERRFKGEWPVNRTIKEIRPMTAQEMEEEGWAAAERLHCIPTVLVLEDDTKIYASADEEGNRPGELFYVSPQGEHGMFFVQPQHAQAKQRSA